MMPVVDAWFLRRGGGGAPTTKVEGRQPIISATFFSKTCMKF